MTLTTRPTPPRPSAAIGPAPYVDARRRAQLQRRRKHAIDGLLAAASFGFGACLALALSAESRSSLRAAGGWNMAIGRVAGMEGGYLLLLMILLMARLPPLERMAGQDRLALWHRRLAPFALGLITLHVTFITFGYAESAQAGFLHQMGTFISSYPDVLMSLVAFLLLMAIGAISIRIARRHLRYETWWAIHLYTYLALALAFAHQVATGVMFVGHPLARALWSTAWAAAAGAIVLFRFLVPLARTLRHQLRVLAVHEDAPGVVSIVCEGRRLETLQVEGGQFFQWRFLRRGLWWQAHPYSLSALPSSNRLRLTIRTAGDHGQQLARVSPGTRVAIEGPYGTFTARKRHGDGVLLIGAGVGVTPIRAILEELPPHVDVTAIVRASAEDRLVLRKELSALMLAREAVLHEIVGPRQHVRLDARRVQSLVPDVKRRDIYMCGPEAFINDLVRSLGHLGVPEEQIHRERFSF